MPNVQHSPGMQRPSREATRTSMEVEALLEPIKPSSGLSALEAAEDSPYRKSRGAQSKLINVATIEDTSDDPPRGRLSEEANQKTLEAIEAVQLALETKGIDPGTKERASTGLNFLWERIWELLALRARFEEAHGTATVRMEDVVDLSQETQEGAETRSGKKAKTMEPATGPPSSAEEAVREIIRFTPITSNVRINVPQRISIKRNAEYLLEEVNQLKKRCTEAKGKKWKRQGAGEGAPSCACSKDPKDREEERKRKEDERLAQAFREVANQAGYVPRGGGGSMLDPGNRTYARVAEGRGGYEATIEGVGKEQGPTEVIEMVKRAIRPETEGIRINSIYGTKKGMVRVTGPTREDAEKLCRAVEKTSGSTLKATIIKKSRPRVAIKFIDKETTDAQLLECLLKLNKAGERYRSKEEAAKEFCVKGCITNRRQPTTKLAIVEVTPRLRRELLNDWFHVGWHKARVEDHLSVLQCYRCFGIGHKQDRCNKRGQICGRCSEEGHTFRTCKADVARCTLCKTANMAKQQGSNENHEANHPQCPVIQRAINNIRNKIEYE